jgi:hypothetical protein
MNLVLISTSVIALIQVGAIVFGHILGVVAAHDRAIACSGAATPCAPRPCCSPPWSSTP